ncbi:MAG: Maf family protein [Gemmatimonadota bacterium]
MTPPPPARAPLVLASASPRRRQLLEMLGIPVEVRPSHIPEVRGEHEEPESYAARLAREKALSVARELPGALVLGADTTVVLGRHVLEKPADDEDAVRMLMQLQGHTHRVVTAVALAHDGTVHEAMDVTAVTFRPATEAFLRAYVATGEPRDKAGAYGIQGYGAALVEKIDGDFFGVMGLPVRLVIDLLRRAGWEYRFGAT